MIYFLKLEGWWKADNSVPKESEEKMMDTVTQSNNLSSNNSFNFLKKKCL